MATDQYTDHNVLMKGRFSFTNERSTVYISIVGTCMTNDWMAAGAECRIPIGVSWGPYRGGSSFLAGFYQATIVTFNSQYRALV